MNNSNDSIFAPFNFVPLSDYILFPKWAKQISHDIPFSDGISGKIELKINTITPTFVRNGSNRDVKDPRFSFVGSEDNLFIPATSIKGAIRSVLEITSFGKMDKVKNESFGIRDLKKGSFYLEKIKNVYCGWLSCKNNKYIIEDCGEPWRISPEEIDAKLACGLDDFARNGRLKDDVCRTAKYKYQEFVKNKDLYGTFSRDVELSEKKSGTRKFVRWDENGNPGTIVLTGQSSNRKPDKKSKFYEFVFPELEKPVFYIVPDEVMNEFVTIHKNSPDYKEFRKKQLEEGKKVPVFFMLKKENDGAVIESIGLSYMYKYPAFSSVFDALRDNDFSEDYDMAECIFGSENKTAPLKGRVYFGHAFATKATMQDTREVCLCTPHPSYYPLYLGNGQSWNNDDIRIAGRKRYPTRDNIWNHNEGTGDMLSKLTPVTDAEFSETIVFHNLCKAELGALIYALTFGGNADCYHSIGAGKPLGYGKCAVCVTSITDTENAAVNQEECISAFKSLLDKEYSSWKSDPSLKELFAMARGIKKESLGKFRYMHMDTDQKKNEFKAGKDAYDSGEQLGTFTQIISGTVPVANRRTMVSSSIERVNKESQLARIKKQKEEKAQHLLAKYKTAVTCFENNQFVEAKNAFYTLWEEEKYKDCDKYIEEIENQETYFKQQGDALRAQGKYAEAREMYVKCEQYGGTCSQEILACVEAVKKEGQTVTDIVKFTSFAKIGTIAGQIKKCKALGKTITLDDCASMSKIFAEEFPNMKSSERKKWLSFDNWKPIVNELGEEGAQIIFNSIANFK